MENKIRVTILDDHQGIVDGYLYRLSKFPQIEVADTLAFGEDLIQLSLGLFPLKNYGTLSTKALGVFTILLAITILLAMMTLRYR